ncbi:efflux RND transporter periplasmic adaptor subunit [Roseococcus sp. SDR]|uniref:efflux RND transporter periplasmic adaptor subunit n=1 Tax=Roseococcus sp. SDR TaxID=2835532 RepID=UPI001BCE84CE|nr:efflux RND transporter periplasmic adaptor subunit [Roseococcus sp. SDR]MBS7790716.1 efflux RND transporter periplasmic adaptor subunit [Roseococcus sp. SDR]MBV1846030.1 efflux RND transporter periplasmic adaptor subunit [Roseococcus sp. SDR]
MRFFVASVFLAAASLAQPAQAQMGPGGPPPAVGVVEAQRQPVTESTEFIGRIEAINRVELRARITGFLEERLFREGTEVEEGKLLFRIERAPFEAQVEQAQANVASAEAQLANARTSLARARELRTTGTGTQVALDNAQAQERTSAATLLGAQAAVRVAEINLAYTNITAPFAGAIGRSTYTPGNVVSPSSEPLATIVSQDPMRVAFTIAQRTALELRERYEGRGGAAAVVVRIRQSDGTIYPLPGRIDFIDTQVSRDTDSILVRASIPNPIRAGMQQNDIGARQLVDGQFVTVLLEGAQPVMAVTIPRSAIAQDQAGFFVFIVDGEGRAQRRNVTLGRSTAETAVIESGVEAGNRVITEGIQRVRPGQPVNAAPAGVRPGAPPPAGRPG